jgi:hypothetical protein
MQALPLQLYSSNPLNRHLEKQHLLTFLRTFNNLTTPRPISLITLLISPPLKKHTVILLKLGASILVNFLFQYPEGGP